MIQECPICGEDRKEVEFPRAGVRVYYCLICKKSEAIDGFSPKALASAKAVSANEKAKHISAVLHKSYEEISFDILIWGPTSSGVTPDAQKRRELLGALKKNHNASMSEDNCLDDNIPVNLQETIDAEESELLICIASSPGSIGEAHELLSGLGIRGLVWFMEEGKGSYAGQGIAKSLRDSGTVVEFFSAEQIACCAVKTASEFWVRNKVGMAILSEKQIQKAKSLDLRRINKDSLE